MYLTVTRTLIVTLSALLFGPLFAGKGGQLLLDHVRVHVGNMHACMCECTHGLLTHAGNRK